jgi:hypothetical protein
MTTSFPCQWCTLALALPVDKAKLAMAHLDWRFLLPMIYVGDTGVPLNFVLLEHVVDDTEYWFIFARSRVDDDINAFVGYRH